MSGVDPRLAGPGAGSAHPALLASRLHQAGVAAAGALAALLLALGIAILVPHPNLGLALVVVVGTLMFLALLLSTRYEITVSLTVLYLGLLDGPVKLLSASQAASAGRNVLIFAIAAGMLIRIAVGRERIRMPPLSGWVIAYTAVVVIEALNPDTGGLLKTIGGYRQELEFVPFFFFGYMLLRSKRRLRQLFLLLGVIALANGVVGLYQARIGPTALAAWGPGYNTRVKGSGVKGEGVSGRTYVAEGVASARPPALGSDSGFGGGIGMQAIPGLLALLSFGRMRRRWIGMLLCAGALLSVATAASRSSVVILIVALLAYGVLSVLAGLRISRSLATVLLAIALAVGVASFLVAAAGQGVLKRQESLTNLERTEEKEGGGKAQSVVFLVEDLAAAPFGVGLATGGSAGGFGGKQVVQIEGAGTTKEAALNLIGLETGLPGVLLWLGLTISVIALSLRRLRLIVDTELRTYLVAIVSVYIAFTADGFAGPTIAGSPAGTFLWFAPGVIAYWLAGPGLARQRAVLATG